MNQTHTRIEVGTVGRSPEAFELEVAGLPQTVVMNLTKICNLWCKHCYYPTLASKGPVKEKYLSFESLKLVIDEMCTWKNQAVLRVAADGEPLLNPRCLDMLAYSKEKGVTTALTTNGTLLKKHTIERLLEIGINVIDISVDAATPEGYQQVRPTRGGTNHYPEVEKNVRDLIAARNLLGEKSPTKVMVNLIDQPAIHHEVELFKKQWADWGADAVLIRPFHSTSSLTQKEGVVANTQGVKRFPCKYPFTRLNVGFDPAGHTVVYYCSHDWEEKTVVGHLGEETLEEIWTGPALREIRRRHLENDFPVDSFCGTCPDWYLGWGKSHSELVNKLK